jgi:assimilatory nitrate reductase catalytic subunit
MTATVKTTCPYCGVGCGVLARPTSGAPEIRGDPEHPANFGRLCSKGAALGDTVSLEGRLLHPQIHGQRVDWDCALRQVADGFARIIREHGPRAVALYVSGQLLTEDYYVANKLMKGYIGAANIDTNSRLCMSSAVAGHKLAFGADIVPGCYEDLEAADLIVLVGSNTAWCHPVLYQRMMQAKEQRPDLRLVVIDPRRTPTCETADLHLPIRPGTDVALFNGLLAHLYRAGALDSEFVAARTTGWREALEVAMYSCPDAEAVAAATGVDPDRISAFYELFARTEKVVTAFSQGVNQSSSGTDKVNSIINCHLLTGRIGRPGMGPFSLTGQPNAMGGREVGGLANMLAAHMSLEVDAHRRIVQEFWDSPTIAGHPGLKAVELFEAIHAGEVKAVWIMATNPLVSLPDADRARAALERCELVVVSDCIANTDTTALADVLLPACAWGEKSGTVTNSERRISRQRAFLQPPGEAKPDWWIVTQVAKHMGFGAGFPYTSPAGIFDEHARLSAASNEGLRCFDIGGLAGLTEEEYDSLEPIQWPIRRRGDSGTQRLLGDGPFFNPNGAARMVPTAPRAPANAPCEEFPFILNTGRIRDQWHTMTRTSRSPRLVEHLPEPYVDMHAQDALLSAVRAGDLVRVTTKWGTLVARLRTTGEISRGCVFVPIHWSGVFASEARAGSLVNPVVDPVSGEPEFKHTPARIDPFPVEWHGVALTREPLDVSDLTWWTLVPGRSCFRHELGGRKRPAHWEEWARKLLGAVGDETDFLDYYDESAGVYRAVYIVGERLAGCLYVSRRADLPPRDWLTEVFAKYWITPQDRMALLAGRPLGAAPDSGPLVCSCFAVRRAAIEKAIAEHGLTSPRQVSDLLRAGSNCGSCIPEIRKLLTDRADSKFKCRPESPRPADGFPTSSGCCVRGS